MEYIISFIIRKISQKDVDNIAKKENVIIEKLNGIFQYQDVDKINSITYKLAILHNYGEDSTKRKKTNDLLYEFKTGKIPKDKVEGISLIYGINNGYSSFYNFYDKKIVKFKMDSLLDYYIIESIFQHIINESKENREFKYIATIFPEQKLILSVDNIKQKEEKYQSLESLLSFVKNSIFEMTPKELITKIWKEFKKLLDEKDSEIQELNNKVLQLENTKKGNIDTVLPLQKDRKNENVLIEEFIYLYSKKKPRVKKDCKREIY
ncbi:MAG: hypothetical protein Q9M39_03010 [Sulfurovum sp.]|nr:hypothetical protein [Sulfurovum sp.]